MRSTLRELVNRSLQFHKRSELFIGAHNETLSEAVCAQFRDVTKNSSDALFRALISVASQNIRGVETDPKQTSVYEVYDSR